MTSPGAAGPPERFPTNKQRKPTGSLDVCQTKKKQMELEWPIAGKRPAPKTIHRLKSASGVRLRGMSRQRVLTIAMAVAPYCGILISGAAQEAAAKKPADPWGLPQKPSWLADLSLTLHESYDNNVFLTGANAQYFPNNWQTNVPAGGVAALKNRSSWVTTVSPKIGVNFAPLLGDQKTLQTLSLGYAPDFVTYHDQSSESYDLHRFATAVKGKADAFSFSLDNAFHYIDGNKYGVTYPGSFNSAYATGTLRERRDQFQDRAKAVFQYNLENWFIRPVAAFQYYDLRTEQLNLAGYQNYADRYDVNGGSDFGYRLNPDLTITAGYRYGHQYQQKYSFDPLQLSSSSDYNRVLFGIEGKPLKWLKVELQGGPDFRNYADSAPVNDKSPVKYYGEASLTADIDAKDSIGFKYKQFQWVSSTGKIPYFDSLYELTYRRKLADSLNLELGGRLSSSDYTSGNTASGLRDDWLYTASAALRYSVNTHLSFDLAYAADLGRNAQDNLPTAQLPEDKREYTRHQVSLGAQLKF